MKQLTSLAICLLSLSLAACGSDEKTTVIHERPVIVQPAASVSMPMPSPDTVEAQCKHGYDNRTHSCY